MLNKIRRYLNMLSAISRETTGLEHAIRSIAESEVRVARAEVMGPTPDNPALAGFSVYSQNDEDGIIHEIFRRIGGGKTFLEIGCGHGLENNTHFLALQGWMGTWIDGNADNIARIREQLPDSPKLLVRHIFVDRENIRSLARDVDFLSLDIDGNDIHVLRAFIEVSKPKVICTEYNAAFPPPCRIEMHYDANHTWDLTHYQGASLQAFVDSLPDYRLVCCNLSGVNAFFVRNDLAAPFSEYPVCSLYRPLRLDFFIPRRGHPRSMRFLADTLSASPQDLQGTRDPVAARGR